MYRWWSRFWARGEGGLRFVSGEFGDRDELVGVAVEAGECCFTSDEQLVVVVNGVLVFDAHARGLDEVGGDVELVIVARRFFVVDLEIDNNDERAFLFDLRVGHPVFA